MKLILFSVVFLMLLPSCKKDKDYKPTLPDVTTSGANTMGFVYGESSIWTAIFKSYDMFGTPHYEPSVQCQLQHFQDSSSSFYITGSMYIKNKNGIIPDNSDITIYLNKAVLTNK